MMNSITLFSDWRSLPSKRLRQFAYEAIRPKGIWSSHIPILKDDPALGLPIIEPLQADPSAYVQDSVGNWPNDAAKDRPRWARALCDRWLQSVPPPATIRICRRAMRTLK